jgi:hypothetical protein
MASESSAYVSRNSVTFSGVLAGHERDRLVGALAVLRAELAPEGDPTGTLTLPRARAVSLLDEHEETLVRELGRALARIAAAAAAASPPTAPLPETITLGTVGGAEWVMRRELQDGRSEELVELVPDFVYLITLPYLQEAGAKAAAVRSRELIADGKAEGED